MAQDDVSPAALKQQLDEFKTSLEELNDGLKLDPSNEELLKLRSDLLELIASTENSLRSLAQNSAADRSPPAAAAVAAPAPHAEAGIAVGDKVFAIYSADGRWYDAQVTQILENGNYSVTYTGYGNTEERERGHLRRADGSITLEKLNEAMGGATAEGKKRTSAAWELPSKDPKKQAKQAAKPKKEEPTVQAWKQFATKATKLKSGTGTPKRKESIFKSPDAPDGKVGVVGSGKPMTKYTETRQKWDKLKDPGADGAPADD